MPTVRPRHVLTETDQVAAALDDAAKRWPDVTSRSKLLARLVEEGHRSLISRTQRVREERAEAVASTSGIFNGLYEPGYLERLREDWPE